MSTEPTLVSLVNKTVEQANFSTGSDQLKWIEEDLAHVDRCKTPWVILGGHRPMYIDSTYGGNPASDLVRAGRFSKYEEQGQNIHVLVYVAFTNILCALLLSLSLYVGQDVMQELQKYVEPLLVKYNVNVGVYGHNHAYQRLCSSLGGKCMQRSSSGVRNEQWIIHRSIDRKSVCVRERAVHKDGLKICLNITY